MAEPILTVSGLVAGYGRISAIKHIDFQAYNGEIVGVVGPNGAGKTTLLETIAGTIDPKAGQITYLGKRIDRLSVMARRKMGILLVPQDSYLFPVMSVKKNLDISGLLNTKVENKKFLEYVHDLFPILKERKKQIASTLSGGQQKMLAVGMGIIANTKVMLIDEPSIGLEPKLVTKLFENLRQLKEDTGKALVLAEQNVKVLDIADRIFGLEAGEIQFSSKTADLGEEVVKELFLGK